MPAWYDTINPEAPVLAQQLEGFTGAPYGFIGDLILPKVPVPKDKATIFKFTGRETRTLYTNIKYAPRTEVAEIAWTVETGEKVLEDHAARLPWADSELAFAGDPIKAQFASVAPIGKILALQKEYEIATLLTTAGNYSATSRLDPAVAWDPTAADTPLADINSMITEIRKQTGQSPDFMIISPDVKAMMRTMPEFTDLLATTRDQIIDNKLISDFFEIADVYDAMDMYYDHDLGYFVNLWVNCIVIGIRGRVDAIPAPGLAFQYVNDSMTTAEVYRKPDFKTTYYQASQFWLVDMAANNYGALIYSVI